MPCQEAQHVYLLEAVVQQAELLVPPHHRRRQRVLRESTLRLLVREQKLTAVVYVLLTGKPALGVKVVLLVSVLPLIIIIILITSVTEITTSFIQTLLIQTRLQKQ